MSGVVGLEAFTKGKEKRVLASLFGGSASDSEDNSDAEGGDVLHPSSPHTSQQDLVPLEEEIRTFHSTVAPTVSVRVVERRIKGIAHQLWPAAEYLSDYIGARLQDICGGSARLTVIELGAGLGLTGLFVAAQLQRNPQLCTQYHVHLTDVPEALPGLQENIALNQLQDVVSAEVLWWGNTEHIERTRSWSTAGDRVVILAADVVYFEHLFTPLVDTLVALCALHTSASILLAHIKRWKKDNKFFVMCKKRGLEVAVVDEQVLMLTHPHTHQPEKQVRRIYAIRAVSKP